MVGLAVRDWVQRSLTSFCISKRDVQLSEELEELKKKDVECPMTAFLINNQLDQHSIYIYSLKVIILHDNYYDMHD